MKGKKKTPKVAGFMRHVLAANVRACMDHVFKESPNKPKSLAKEAGVTLSTIQRIIKAEVGASVDNVELIAAALNLSVYQLFVPSLDVTNPQVIKGASKDEELIYARWRKIDRLKQEEVIK